MFQRSDHSGLQFSHASHGEYLSRGMARANTGSIRQMQRTDGSHPTSYAEWDDEGERTDWQAMAPQEGVSSFGSHGSAGHATGECRPCAHYWRQAGCNRGDMCERCHLCPQGAFLAYRQGLKAGKRRQKNR
eukprot:TRINITY_DN22780_c0_g1_i1.p1 TRINITY_DN22780_c0_g1~~TRINITY_DN22780_c0_g1_i1.p1  ORF type:complete len:131 (+),score=8.17 TRINITY_DN22780_c0_g1_i1:335-727(+)